MLSEEPTTPKNQWHQTTQTAKHDALIRIRNNEDTGSGIAIAGSRDTTSKVQDCAIDPDAHFPRLLTVLLGYTELERHIQMFIGTDPESVLRTSIDPSIHTMFPL